jgi:nitrite reductase/ring-hydroxylating ferredoxin subunit
MTGTAPVGGRHTLPHARQAEATSHETTGPEPTGPEPTGSGPTGSGPIGSGQRERVGTLDELKAKGYLTGKIGPTPVCVFLSDGQAYAVDDRCPHMGFPLHRGTVENGLLTCHWHHARFDLVSGGTLDPFADDVRAHDVEVESGDVVVVARPGTDRAGHHLRRLEEGLEQGLTLVTAKAVLGLGEVLGPERSALAAIGAGVTFGVRNRDAGWGSGLTVLTAMANVLPHLEPDDRLLALVHGLAFVSRDTRGRPPRFPLAPLEATVPADRLLSWYRRFVDTRNGDAAERVLATATARGAQASSMAALMGAAATDHLFLDGGHTIDFTNKAFEVLDHLGWEQAGQVLPTLAHQTARAGRAEETGEWRHPDDIVMILRELQERPGSAWANRGVNGGKARTSKAGADNVREGVDALAWAILGDDPTEIVASLDKSAASGASAEELARAVAYAAALRLTRFHTQNDHGDWDVVHHGFTTANAVHQLVRRNPTPELVRGIYQGAMKVFLDRFLNVPAARLPGAQGRGGGEPRAGEHRPFDDRTGRPDLRELQQCFNQEGMVDEAGAIVHGWLRSGGDTGAVVKALGSALLAEDAEFHWFQTYEAAVRQVGSWPPGSEQAALILAGTARFLAAHTPTRRELAQVVRIAGRLRRGEALYEEI